jgi:hypothetical protein
MKTTELVAWIGATTGVASLGWNIYTKITANRPKLVVKAYANMIQMPPPPKNPRFLRITVQNIGTAPTTITNVEFFEAISTWKHGSGFYPSSVPKCWRSCKNVFF